MLKLGSVRLELSPRDSANVDQKGASSIGFKHLSFDAPKLELATESLRRAALNPIRSLMSVSTSPVVGWFYFVTLKEILSSS